MFEGKISSRKLAPASDSRINVYVRLELFLAVFPSFLANRKLIFFNLMLAIHGEVDPSFETAMFSLATFHVSIVPAVNVCETLLTLLLSVLLLDFSH